MSNLKESSQEAKAAFRKLSEDFLVPLFSNAWLRKKTVKSTEKEQPVARIHPNRIGFKPRKDCDYRFVLERSQKFGDVSDHAITEHRIIESFVSVFNEIKEGLNEVYKDDLLSTFPRRVIVKSICSGPSRQQTSLKIIDQLSRWSVRQYEGKPITAAIGLSKGDKVQSPSVETLDTNDYYSVISNGFDTMLRVNYQGNLMAHESLPRTDASPTFAPHRQGPIAQWTKRGGIAFVLNRLGEISIFKDGMLLFVRRSAKWHFLNHKPILMQMFPPKNLEVRNAIYETCLDASFAHSGGCVGVVTKENKKRWERAVGSNDKLKNKSSEKAKTFSQMIGNRKFHELDRRFRQELIAIDGATLISHSGKVLAVGAILKIPGGSTGGGRLAAAKALSDFGLGIKVSQDGSITGYRSKKNMFSIM